MDAMIVNDDTSVDNAHELGHGGRTVICLHGWFGSSSGWGDGFVGALDPEQFRYEFVDYRGYGDRRGSGGPYTIDQIAADVLELADDLGVERFSLVGHSMGASAVLRVLALAPERVEAVVGINPVPASGSPFDDDGRQLFESAAADDMAREAIIDITTGKRLSAYWIDQVVAHSRSHSDQEAFGAYFGAWADTDHAAEVPVGKVPALAVVGEHDAAITDEVVRGTWGALFPESEYEILANAGHYPMFETPVRLATRIEEFLASVPR
ncbi:hydrolase [Ornithinimicrobium tianjinense]|uniref:Hydrolase n=2 Tax=Ornithinimicrobium tianjinense TaxID=1195761 RepID=A0A917BQ95_9MICO|nr:hydrolase [Ornithinimicrobium tianjinense]